MTHSTRNVVRLLLLHMSRKTASRVSSSRFSRTKTELVASPDTQDETCDVPGGRWSTSRSRGLDSAGVMVWTTGDRLEVVKDGILIEPGTESCGKLVSKRHGRSNLGSRTLSSIAQSGSSCHVNCMSEPVNASSKGRLSMRSVRGGVMRALDTSGNPAVLSDAFCVGGDFRLLSIAGEVCACASLVDVIESLVCCSKAVYLP